MIENEEFVLRPEERLVGDARRCQVRFGAIGEGARTAVVSLHRGRLDDVAAQVDGGFVREDVDNGR